MLRLVQKSRASIIFIMFYLHKAISFATVQTLLVSQTPSCCFCCCLMYCKMIFCFWLWNALLPFVKCHSSIIFVSLKTYFYSLLLREIVNTNTDQEIDVGYLNIMTHFVYSERVRFQHCQTYIATTSTICKLNFLLPSRTESINSIVIQERLVKQ